MGSKKPGQGVIVNDGFVPPNFIKMVASEGNERLGYVASGFPKLPTESKPAPPEATATTSTSSSGSSEAQSGPSDSE